MIDQPKLINREEKPETKAPAEPKSRKDTKPKPKQEVAVVPQNLPSESMNPMALLAQAVQQNLDVEKMGKLMDLQERWEKNQAKKAFDNAMANFQGECPVIKKEKAGGQTKSGQVAYYYAPLDAIVSQTKELIEQNGFSYMIKTETLEGKVKVTCIIKHELGHSEESTIEVPLGSQTGVMSNTQVVAAALTFAKRYAFCNAFGILTGDDDDDANITKPTIDPIDASIEMIKSSKNISALQDYKNKVMKHPSFTEQQKSRIIDIVDTRIEELKNPK